MPSSVLLRPDCLRGATNSSRVYGNFQYFDRRTDWRFIYQRERCGLNTLLANIRGFCDLTRILLNKGMALGSDRFKEEIEALTGRRLSPKKVGRPVGWRKEKGGE